MTSRPHSTDPSGAPAPESHAFAGLGAGLGFSRTG